MLRFLSIRNLAVIDALELEFEPGFNVLTGETGAGKSVLVEAIDLLLGGRATTDLVRTGESLATVQAIFERPDGRETIVRRELSAEGRSRAFIDDALATNAALRELGIALVALHGQHEHHALLDPAAHRHLLDGFGQLDAGAAATAGAFATWRQSVQACERTQLDAREKAARIELIAFQLQEIAKVDPRPDEDVELEAERAVLANADRLSRLAREAYSSLYEGDGAALAALAIVWKRVADLAAIDPRFEAYADQREDMKARLEDLAYFLRGYLTSMDASPERLQVVEDRLAAIERVKKRHGGALALVLERRRAFEEELAALDASDERIAALDRSRREAAARFLATAQALSAARREAARRLSASLQRALEDLAMAGSRVDIRVASAAEREDRWTEGGIDEVEFYLSPNLGEDLRPLARIASGGELSRIMLALRTLESAPSASTLIFDEVDAGIGGTAADAVGLRLQALGESSQVLCVTHLAQIAARADAHYEIVKAVSGGRTSTRARKLDEPGREGELARMIAGAQVSAEVLASARAMRTARHRSETKPKGESESRAARAKAKVSRRGA